MTVDIGILSTAHVHTDVYATLVTKFDGCELIGVADADSDRGRTAAEDYGAAYLPTDELLAQVNGVIVCSTNADHREYVERAAAAGVDVLCEKPLAPNVEDAKAIVDVCEEAGVELGVAMPLRFSEPIRRAGRTLAAGDLGELRSISGTNRGQIPDGWFTDPERAGGGATMDHTVHIVDLVYHMTGKRVTEVYAELGMRFSDSSVEDVNVLSMKLEDETQFLLDGSWSKPDNWRSWGDATLELIGERATVSVNCFGQRLTRTTDTDGETGGNSEFWGTDPNEALVRDFISAISTGDTLETSGEEGVMAVAVVEAAYRSHETGAPVAVDY